MTTAALSTAPAPARRDPAPIGRRYGRMWARLPRELGYLALTALIGLVVATTAWSVVGAGSAFIPLGVLLLLGLMLASRYLGAFDLRRLRWARTTPIAAPVWTPPFAGKRPLRALGDIVADGHYWLYALHAAVVSPLLALVTFTVWSTWLGTALVAVASPIWGTVPIGDGTGPLWADRSDGTTLDVNGHGFAGLVVWLASGSADPAAAAWAIAGVTALGLLMLALLPFLTRGATLAHWGAARLLLGRFASDDLRGEVAKADAARLAAVTAEDTALRRLERDIHDGPQQRLLRLQMELATAERRLGDASEAAEPLAAARRLAAETLDELRALAQGFAPPLLQDRGLSAALGALGRRGAVPVETAIVITGDVPDAVERSVYFIAAELTTNAIKHADASRIRLETRTEQDDDGRSLRLTVTDDGRGGAEAVPGHGLAGAAERLAGLGGSMTVTSPEGGPTTVDVRVPLR